MQWKNWQEFKIAQRHLVLHAGRVNHLGMTVSYIDVGTATKGTLLLMHGIPTWGFLYNAVITQFVDEGYRVLVPDFLGHGWSDRRDGFDRSFQDQARMIVEFLVELDVEQVDVVGHDTGGAVALILAIEHAYLVSRLIICNSVCYDRFDDDMLDLGHPMRWMDKSIDDLQLAVAESLGMGISRPAQLTNAFCAGMLAPCNSEEGKLSLLRNASALNANQTMALVDRYSTINLPTLVLWGMDDPWQKSADGMRLYQEIPGASFKPVIGASPLVTTRCIGRIYQCRY